jgi:hypothetical protein
MCIFNLVLIAAGISGVQDVIRWYDNDRLFHLFDLYSKIQVRNNILFMINTIGLDCDCLIDSFWITADIQQ